MLPPTVVEMQSFLRMSKPSDKINFIGFWSSMWFIAHFVENVNEPIFDYAIYQSFENNFFIAFGALFEHEIG